VPVDSDWDNVVTRALEEDVGSGDVTTGLLGIVEVPARAAVVARDNGVLFGVEVARRVFRALDRRVIFKTVVEDGRKFTAGRAVATLQGTAGPILAGERMALNFIQRLSGVATLTAAFVARADNVAVTILDTRKTTPGLRSLEKAAVRAGGGENHRQGLYDGIMIKDNHKRLSGGVATAVKRAREQGRPGMPIFVEVETLGEAEEAAAAGADVIMLDNFAPDAARAACIAIAGRAVVEVSGGVTLSNVATFARSGATRISVGALTHSAPALDFSLEVEV